MGTPSQRVDGYFHTHDGNLPTSAFDASPEALAVLDHGRILHANPAFGALFGSNVPQEMLGCAYVRSSSPAQSCSQSSFEEKAWASNGHPLCRFRETKLDGSPIEIEATCSPFVWQGRNLVVVCLRDVTQRERRRTVRDSQKRYEAIFRASAVGLLQCDLKGEVVESNPAAERILGHSHDELRGMHFLRVPSDSTPVEQELFADLAGGARDIYQLEVPYRGKGERPGWVRRSVSLVRDPNGVPESVIAMIEDITEGKHAEQQLRDAQKMEVVGRLVGGVAHDFNNLLTGVMLYCDLLLAGLDRSSRLGHHAEEIRLAAEQGAALIQQLLAIARQQVVEPRRLSLNDTITRTHNLLDRLIGEGIEIETQLEAGLGEVRMDPAQVQQVLFNLVLNARDAMPLGGRILVETANCEFSPSGAFPASVKIPGVRFAVTDNGTGMSAETRAHLFEPFFTTKKAGRGNGLGLSTVHDIVQNNGGAIEVDSELGQGTQVRVFLPRALEPAVVIPNAGFCEGSISETILLLEDNSAVRMAAERVLSDCGYRVLEAANGEDALALAESFPGSVDLFLADVDVPGMSSREVARRLAVSRPLLKHLYMSGYKVADADDPEGDASIVFFQKPFTGAVLLQRVREILDSKHCVESGKKEREEV
jgi:PAS domain S-box-containing protein